MSGNQSVQTERKANEIKSIESLKNGKSHDSFCFVVNDEKYVYRMPVEGTELPIKRLNEA